MIGGNGPTTDNRIAMSEYDFYKNNSGHGPQAPIGLSEEEKSLYGILAEKVAYGGIEALSKTGFNNGSVYNKKNPAAYIPAGDRANPVIVSSLQEAQQRSGSATLQRTDVASGKTLPAGLYQDSNMHRYYFVFQNDKRKAAQQNISQQTNLGSAPVTVPTTKLPDVPKPPKIKFPKAKGVKTPDDDLIFNSADYQSTYEEAIKEISLALIKSGDDIISTYNYESIDSLPDYDIEIKIAGGEYLNAKEVIEKGLLGGDFQSLLDDSTSSEEVEQATKLLEYLEGKIGVAASYSDILTYFGSFNADNVTFNSGVKKRNADSPDIDFYIEIPDDYQIPGVNEIKIRFDLI